MNRHHDDVLGQWGVHQWKPSEKAAYESAIVDASKRKKGDLGEGQSLARTTLTYLSIRLGLQRSRLTKSTSTKYFVGQAPDLRRRITGHQQRSGRSI